MGAQGSRRSAGASRRDRSSSRTSATPSATAGRRSTRPPAPGAALLLSGERAGRARVPAMRRAPRGPAVYIVDNPAMPGLIKVGMTTVDSMERIASLSASTMVPMPFRLVYAVRVADPQAVESWMHRRLARYRVNHSREFFAVEPEVAVELLQRWAPGGRAATWAVARRGVSAVRLLAGSLTVALWAFLAIVAVERTGDFVRGIRPASAPLAVAHASGPGARPQGGATRPRLAHHPLPPPKP